MNKKKIEQNSYIDLSTSKTIIKGETLHSFLSLYKSLSSFLHLANIKRKLSQPQGNPAAIRATSIVVFPRAFAWSYLENELVNASFSSSPSASSFTCAVTSFVNLAWLICNGGRKNQSLFMTVEHYAA